jgi:hypothetical protein
LKFFLIDSKGFAQTVDAAVEAENSHYLQRQIEGLNSGQLFPFRASPSRFLLNEERARGGMSDSEREVSISHTLIIVALNQNAKGFVRLFSKNSEKITDG